MKKFLTLAFLALVLAAGASAPFSYPFAHGPYLQGLAPDEVSVYFADTDHYRGLSWVELKRGDSVERIFASHDGLIDAYDKMNVIRIRGLQPDTEYEYRVSTKRITDFQPYKVTYGDSIASRWYKFRTLDPKAEDFTFVVVPDIHGDTDKYSRLLSYMPMDSVQMVFLNGDMMDYMDSPERPYDAFIDASVSIFATRIPFVAVRGNHETRGAYARYFARYVHKPEGRFYGLYMVGETAVLVLDTGEDKPDGHPVYAGLTDFDNYLHTEAEWLARKVRSKAFRGASHRIVVMHQPPMSRGPGLVRELFMPILEKAKIDLMLCGHTHRAMSSEQWGFPVVVNDNHSASLVRVTREGITVRTTNEKGEEI